MSARRAFTCVAVTLVLIAALGTRAALVAPTPVPTPAEAHVTQLWRAPLDRPAAPNASAADAVGRSVFVGDGEAYATTDEAGALYVFRVADGARLWTYDAWPALPAAEARARWIGASSSVLFVIRGGVGYCLDAASGALRWSRAIPPGFGSWAWVDETHILIVGEREFETWSLATGALAWRFTDLWTPEYGALAVGWDEIAALRLVSRSPALSASVVVMRRATGAVLHEVPLTAAMVGDTQPQIFQLRSDYILFYAAAAVVKLGLPSGKPLWTRPLAYRATSYGLGDPYFYLRTPTYLASYNLTTGDPVADIDLTQVKWPASCGVNPATDKLVKINHLWGFNEFASLGLLFESSAAGGGSTTTSQFMVLAGLNGANMTLRYCHRPPAAASMNDYGNTMAAGLIAVPAADGLTLIGARGNTWANTSGFPLTVPASLVLNTKVVVFASGGGVQALALPSPSLWPPA